MVRSGLGGGSGGGSRRDGDAGSEPVYPEELEDDNVAPRLDIELINISDDEDDVIITGSRKTNKAMRPIRLERQEHVERPTVVNVETKTGVDLKALDKKREVKSEKDTDSMFVEHSIKGENDMDLDSIPHVSRDGSVDLDAPADRRESIDLDATVPEPYTEEQMAERRAGKSKTKTKKKSKPVLQTQEDLAEYEILLNDTAEISQQLATLQASSTALNGDIEMGEDGQPKADNPDHKEGRLYLFQFPPILPRLMTEEELEKERDGVKTDAGGDIEMSDIPAANASDPVDLTAAASTPASPTKFKAEPTEVLPPNPVSTPQPLVNEAGQIGRLVVRKSGKVEVSWGGTSLALSNGAKTDFLTKGVVVHGVDKGGKQNREITKEEEMKMLGTGMGKLWGKFVATPDWEKLL